MTPEDRDALRAPFPPEAIGKLPKAGLKLDYVGHAGVTDRLLSVDPDWTWEPMATNELGLPLITAGGLWIRMTVCGVTRPGFGDGPDIKQMISDAIRNAAMRFGVALDLWSKEDLRQENAGAGTSAQVSPGSVLRDAEAGTASATSPLLGKSAGAGVASSSLPAPDAAPAESKLRKHNLKARCVALTNDNVSVADAREELKLPLVDSCNEEELTRFEALVSDLEAALEAPFEKADA